MKDTLRTFNDCILNIELARIDKTAFLFPTQYLIGEDTRNVDLMYNIERLEGGEFVYYRCKQSPIAQPAMPDGKPELQKLDKLSIIDSLNDLGCINRGKYRLQILYNNRDDGGYKGPDIQAKSNWVEFYVDNQRLLIGAYYRFRAKEIRAGKQKNPIPK